MPRELANLGVVELVDVRIGRSEGEGRVLPHILHAQRVDDRRVVRHPARVAGSTCAARLSFFPLVGLLIAHEPRRAERRQSAGHAVELVDVQNVAGDQRSARAASVDVIDLRPAEKRVVGVALKRLRDRQSAELLGDLEHRMLDGHLGDIGDRHLVAPLDGGGRHHRHRHRLALRRHAFGERRIGERKPVPSRRLILDAAALGELQRIGEAVDNQPAPRERQGLVGDIRLNVGRERG